MNAKLLFLGLFLLLAWLLPVTPVSGQPWRALGDTRTLFPMDTVALSPDGKLLLAADISLAARVLVIDVASGKPVRELSGHQRYVNQFAFSPDSRFVYTGGHPHGAGYATPDKAVHVWELNSGKRVQEFPADMWALSPDGRILLLVENLRRFRPAGEQNPLPPICVLRFLDTTTWKELGKIVDENVLITALAISADGKTVAWAGTDYQIRLVDLQSRRELRRFQAPKTWIQGPKVWADMTSGISFLAWAPDGKTLASVTDTIINLAQPRTINIWDVASGKAIQKLVGPEEEVSGLAYTPQGDRLLVTGRRGGWLDFGMPAGKKLPSLRRAYTGVLLALHRQGKVPTADSPPFLVDLWDIATCQDLESGRTPDQLFCLAALPDGKTVVTGERGQFLRFWDLERGKEIRRVHDPDPELVKSNASTYALAYSPTDKCLVSAHWNDAVKFWSPEDGRLLPFLPRATAYQHLAVARDGQLATAQFGAVHLWPHKKAQPHAVKLGSTQIWTMQFSHDSKMLLVAGWEGLHLIDVPGKKVLRVLEPKTSFPAAALSPDGKTLATLGRHDRLGVPELEKHIRLWDLESGQELRKIAANPPPDYGMLCFSPDGRSLLAHHQGGLSVWEVESGQVRYSASGKGKGFSSNGRLLFSLTDRQIFVWDLTGAQTGGVLQPVQHSPQTQAELWADLQPNVPAARAYRALWRLVADKKQTASFLEKKVLMLAPLDAKAAKAADRSPPPEKILACRIVEVLEQLGTVEAQRLLETLATPAKPQFTEIARQALVRLRDR